MIAIIPFVFAFSSMLSIGPAVTEENLSTLFNSADICIANAATIAMSVDRYNCCNIMEQTWQFLKTLDMSWYSPELQEHAAQLASAIYPFTQGPNGVGQLGPIIDGVAVGCIPPGRDYAVAPPISELE